MAPTNNSGVKSWLKEGWKPLLPEDQYTQSNKDDSPYEGDLWEKVEPVFPYNLWKLSEKGKDANILKSTPYGNSVITDFTLLALKENELGKDDYTDLTGPINFIKNYRRDCVKIGKNAMKLFDKTCTPKKLVEWIKICIKESK